METLELILLLAAAVLISAVIDQLVPKISSPLIQISLGIGIALFAVAPIEINFEPEFFLLVFIAPLLYNDARHVNKANLWKNKKSIMSLAIGLVVVIMLAVGFFLNWLEPSIPLAAAFALGAALGPTDAVAVASLSKEAKLNSNESALLEGEALLNDASGVVSFQFAIAAAITGAFSVLEASINFVIGFFGGILLGVIFALLANALLSKIRDMGLESITFHVLFDLLVPFIVYLLAEVLHLSGILAVVAAGLVISRFSERSVGPAASRLNIISSSVWRVLSFALNGIVFVLLGMQLPRAMQSTWDDVQLSNYKLLAFIVLITLLITLVRFRWIVITEHFPRDKTTGRRKPLDKAHLKSALVTTIGGPKGAVTLSIIFSIPFFLLDGSAFPQRDLIIFLASGVILCTLLMANFLLPVFAPVSTEAKKDLANTAEVRINILRAVIEGLSAVQTKENERATQAVIKSYSDRIERIKTANDIEDPTDINLQDIILQHQQKVLITMIENRNVDEVAAYRYLNHITKTRRALKHKGNLIGLLRSTAGHFKAVGRLAFRVVIRLLPGISEPQTQEAVRTLRIKCEKETISLLQNLLQSEEYPTELVSRSLLSHQDTLHALESALPSITLETRVSNTIEDVRRQGLKLELNQIQDRYDDGSLPLSVAKQMRDNVYLMQLDLENNV